MEETTGTSIANAGTGGDWATNPSVPANYLTYSTSCPEGSRCFKFGREFGRYIYSGSNNFTSEKLEAIIWYNTNNVTTNPSSIFWQIGNGDAGTTANELKVYQKSNSDEITISFYGNSGSEGVISTTDCNLVADTWVRLRFVIDASHSGPDVAIYKSTDGVNETAVTMGSWDTSPAAAVFNSPVYVSATQYNAWLCDHFKLRSTE